MAPYKHSADDEELDRLLRRARWTEPRDEQTLRLAKHWQAIQSARRRRRLASVGLAMAAGILLVVTILAMRDSPKRLREVAAEPEFRPTETPELSRQSPAPKRIQRPEAPDTASRSFVSRDPNLYERVVMIRAINKTRRRAAAIDRKERTDLVNELIDLMAENPQASMAERLAPLETDLVNCERQLWKVVRQEQGERRLGAARLLSLIASPRSLSVLRELADDRSTHAAAVLGLGRLASNRDLARLASVEADGSLRRALLGKLLERASPDAVGFYLAFVNDIGTRSEALGALASMHDPPADALLDYLESPQQPVRLAAALALSRVSDAAVVEQLCARVAGIGRREALIGLLLSSSEKATGCLNEARANLYLVASVRAAERQLSSLQLSRGGNLP